MQMEQLRKDMMAAMKARDKERKDAISSLVSAVKKNAIDAGCRDDIPEDMVNATIMKELKTVQEQIDSCPADRTDLLEEYRKRYDIMKEYAPKMLSKEEVTAIVKEKFADVIATKNKGQIMKTIMPELKGRSCYRDVQRIKEKKHEIVYADEGIFWHRLCFGKRCRVKSIRKQSHDCDGKTFQPHQWFACSS